MMGARIVLCDPHRALVAGPSRAARRDARVPRHPRRHGDAARRALRRRDEHDQQHRPDRARLRADRRAPPRARRPDHPRRARRSVLAAPRGGRGLRGPRRAGLHDDARRRRLRLAERRAGARRLRALGGAPPRPRASSASPRLATAQQVHGARVLDHGGELGRAGSARRTPTATSRATPGTAMAVTIADCVPIFIAHPRGAAALLHSGWRGTAARIVEQGIAAFERAGHRAARPPPPPRPRDLRPLLRGEPRGDPRAHRPRRAERHAPVDLRAIIADARPRPRRRARSRRAPAARAATTTASSRTAPATHGRQLAVLAAL